MSDLWIPFLRSLPLSFARRTKICNSVNNAAVVTVDVAVVAVVAAADAAIVAVVAVAGVVTADAAIVAVVAAAAAILAVVVFVFEVNNELLFKGKAKQ